MLTLFPNCRSYIFLGAAVSIALFTLFLTKGWQIPAVIILFLGLFISRFFAEFMALKQHQKFLAVLYYGKQPKKFTELYEQLLSEKKLADHIRFTSQSHLVNGYIAAGNFSKALDILDHMPKLAPANEAYGKSLIAGNRCLIYCLQDDLEQAETYYEDFISYGESITKKRSRQSYIQSKSTLTTRIKMLRGTSSKQDAFDLRERLKAPITPYQKIEVQYLLGRVYLILKETAFAKNCLKEAANAGDQLYVARRAKEFLK